jgi:transcriptional regulator with XRE-family HTH domain
MDNLVRMFRERLGLNQHQFGDLIGRSYASVQGYESGKHIPDAVLERMRAIARERGLEFDAPPADRNPGTPQRSKPATPTKHQRWHQMLDKVLDSALPKAVNAVQSNLILFNDYVDRHQQPKKTERIG